jgi:hypothetical protein
VAQATLTSGSFPVLSFLAKPYPAERQALTTPTSRRAQDLTGSGRGLHKGKTMKDDNAKPPASKEERFQLAISRSEEAGRQLLKGDPAPYRHLYSQRDDVTLYGGEGGRLQGFAAVSRQLDWIAQQMKHMAAESVEFEYLVTHVGSEVGYTIGTQHVWPKDSLSAVSLRVTHIYRYEQDEWRLVHRHGDPHVDMDEKAFERVYGQT